MALKHGGILGAANTGRWWMMRSALASGADDPYVAVSWGNWQRRAMLPGRRFAVGSSAAPVAVIVAESPLLSTVRALR